MRHDAQRGATLVEVLVAMGIASILLVGLGSALLNVAGRYQSWVDRLDSASTGDGLAARLQADGHRYVVCGPQQAVLTLYLCFPDNLDPGNAAVRYSVSGTGPYVITRQARTDQSGAFMARSLSTTQPNFTADCYDAGDTVSGHIVVQNLRLQDGAGNSGASVSSQSFNVYYLAPWRSGCTP